VSLKFPYKKFPDSRGGYFDAAVLLVNIAQPAVVGCFENI